MVFVCLNTGYRIELRKMDQNHRIGHITLIKKIYPKNDDIDDETYSRECILVRLLVRIIYLDVY